MIRPFKALPLIVGSLILFALAGAVSATMQPSTGGGFIYVNGRPIDTAGAGGGGISVEVDPVWSTAKVDYVTIAGLPGLETDPVWVAASNRYSVELKDFSGVINDRDIGLETVYVTNDTPVGDAGYSPAVAVDTNGWLVLAYSDASTIRYGVYNLSSWSLEDTGQTKAYDYKGKTVDIDIDTNNQPHIAWNLDGVKGDTSIQYTRKSGAWLAKEQVDDGNPRHGTRPQIIQVQTNDDVFVLYHVGEDNGYNSGATYNRRNVRSGGAWGTPEVYGENDGRDSHAIDMLIDENSNIHVAYQKRNTGIMYEKQPVSGGRPATTNVIVYNGVSPYQAPFGFSAVRLGRNTNNDQMVAVFEGFWFRNGITADNANLGFAFQYPGEGTNTAWESFMIAQNDAGLAPSPYKGPKDSDPSDSATISVNVRTNGDVLVLYQPNDGTGAGTVSDTDLVLLTMPRLAGGDYKVSAMTYVRLPLDCDNEFDSVLIDDVLYIVYQDRVSGDLRLYTRSITEKTYFDYWANRPASTNINAGGYSITNVATESIEFVDGSRLSVDGTQIYYTSSNGVSTNPLVGVEVAVTNINMSSYGITNVSTNLMLVCDDNSRIFSRGTDIFYVSADGANTNSMISGGGGGITNLQPNVTLTAPFTVAGGLSSISTNQGDLRVRGGDLYVGSASVPAIDWSGITVTLAMNVWNGGLYYHSYGGGFRGLAWKGDGTMQAGSQLWFDGVAGTTITHGDTGIEKTAASGGYWKFMYDGTTMLQITAASGFNFMSNTLYNIASNSLVFESGAKISDLATNLLYVSADGTVTQSMAVAGGGGGAGTLQEVLDAGNSATNNMILGRGHSVASDVIFSRIGGQSNAVSNAAEECDVFGHSNVVNASKWSWIRGYRNETTSKVKFCRISGRYGSADGSDNNYHGRSWSSGINSDYNFIGSGQSIQIGSTADYLVIGGGRNHSVGNGCTDSVIGGGDDNDMAANSDYATIIGGQGNDVDASYQIMGGRRSQGGGFVGALVLSDNHNADYTAHGTNTANFRYESVWFDEFMVWTNDNHLLTADPTNDLECVNLRYLSANSTWGQNSLGHLYYTNAYGTSPTNWVGIGTNNPSCMLHIHNADPAVNEVLLKVTTGSGSTRMNCDKDGDAWIYQSLLVGSIYLKGYGIRPDGNNSQNSLILYGGKESQNLGVTMSLHGHRNNMPNAFRVIATDGYHDEVQSNFVFEAADACPTATVYTAGAHIHMAPGTNTGSGFGHIALNWDESASQAQGNTGVGTTNAPTRLTVNGTATVHNVIFQLPLPSAAGASGLLYTNATGTLMVSP